MKLAHIHCFATMLAALLSASCPAGERKQTPFDPALELERLTYAHPRVEKLYRALDGAARRVAGPNWRHEPYRNTSDFEKLRNYQATWSSRAPLRNSAGEFNQPNHTIRVSLSTGASATKLTHIRSVTAQAFYYPAAGWGLRCDFHTTGPLESDSLELTFFRCRGAAATKKWWGDGPVFRIPHARLSGEVIFNDLRYSYAAEIRRDAYDDRTIGDLYRSPESFLRTMLRLYDRLEQSARQRHDAGTLVGTNPLPLGWSPRDGAPILPPTATVSLPESSKQEALSQALEQIERQRQWLRENLTELHDAANHALPLHSILSRAEP